LLTQQNLLGNAWAKIASQLPGRSSNAVKNRWCWLIRRQAAMANDEGEHAPVQEDEVGAADPPPSRCDTWELPGLNEWPRPAHTEFAFEKADGFWIDQSESFWI
jgi:hypothetical protein